MKTPALKPVPKALAQASFAAKRLAKVGARSFSVRRMALARSVSVKTPLQKAVTEAFHRSLDAPDVAEIRPDADYHQPFARSTWVMPAVARRPAITVERWRRSRTSTSSRISQKSC